MANTNIPIFAVGNRADILPAIKSKLLTYPSYIYCKDTNTIAFLDSELNVRDVVGWNQSQIIVVNDLPSAKTARADAFYICNGKGYLFINGIPVPVFKDISEEVSYNNINDIPIVNKYGSATNPIVVADLTPGNYTISGTYMIGGDLSTKYITSRRLIFIVDSDNSNKLITKFSNNKIIMYTMNLETEEVVVSEYATKTWIAEKGYATETYVHEAIDDLYAKLAEQVLVTKMSQLENDAGFLTAKDITRIGNDDIANLF